MDNDFDFSTPPLERVTITRSHGLNDEQVKDLKEAFALFDPEHKEVIPIKHLKNLMRAVAHTPTEAELQDYYNEYDPDTTGELLLNDFLVIMWKRYAEMTIEDEVILAFKVFDKENNGYIHESEFRQMMTNFGDKMTEDEIEEIIRNADSDTEGNIHYVEFVKMMSER
ncbi:calmodulin-like [Drosophila tropicalis]|uniref:calmodulin-like n=1 Tax=Drosophila tropicalis TaxID=46794 RepID=UPI0035ABD5B0